MSELPDVMNAQQTVLNNENHPISNSGYQTI
jgi:hypothetical protein